MASGVISAAVLGVILGNVGAMLPERLIDAGWIALSLTASVYAYGLLSGRPLPVIQRDWIIPSEWVDRGDFVFAIAFGGCFGVGALTRVTYVGYHLLLGLCVLFGNPSLGAFAMALFGLVRTLPVFALPLGAAAAGRPFGYEATVHTAHLMIKLYPKLRPLQVSGLAAVAVIGAGHVAHLITW